VEAARVRFLGDTINIEVIWIPFFRPGLNPEPGNPWYLGGFGGSKIVRPKRSFENSEIALKAAGYFSGLDVALSVFSTIDDFPVYEAHESHYHRMTVAGLEMSRPSGDFVLRMEAAANIGQVKTNPNPMGSAVKQNSLKWLTGLDWTPGGDWTISGQFSGDHVLGSNKAHLRAETYLATLNVSKKILNQLLTVTDMLYADLSDKGFYNAFKIEYEASDNLILSLGADVFWGQSGRFALYEDNTQAWLKVKYYF
jgi:hypothetical protein